MIDARMAKCLFGNLSVAMESNVELLTQLDSAAGDGDLGVSMKQGFAAVAHAAESADTDELGKLMQKCAMALNDAAPSTLGTILSVWLMAGGKTLKGKTQCGVEELAAFVAAGNSAIMARSNSAPGEKTILDALVPAQNALEAAATNGLSLKKALEDAAIAADQGCMLTKQMKAVHGRAAYYAEKTIGLQDGGATVARIIFDTFAQSL